MNFLSLTPDVYYTSLRHQSCSSLCCSFHWVRGWSRVFASKVNLGIWCLSWDVRRTFQYVVWLQDVLQDTIQWSWKPGGLKESCCKQDNMGKCKAQLLLLGFHLSGSNCDSIVDSYCRLCIFTLWKDKAKSILLSRASVNKSLGGVRRVVYLSGHLKD